ncbi:MAG: diguanylate cyclase, partial [Psychromonas sp.]
MLKLFLLFPVFMLCASPIQAALNESTKPKQLTVFLEQNLPYSGFNSHLDSQGLFVDYWSAWSNSTNIPVKFSAYQNEDVEQLLQLNKPAVYSAIDAPLNLSAALKNAPLIAFSSDFYYFSNAQQKINLSLFEKQNTLFVGGLLPEASQLPVFVNMPNVIYKEYPGLFEIIIDIYLQKIDALVLFSGEDKSLTLSERFLTFFLSKTSLSSELNELLVYTSQEQQELLEWINWGGELEGMKGQASISVSNSSLPLWGVSSALLRNLLLFFTIILVLFIYIRSKRMKDSHFKDLVDYSPNPISILSLDASKIFHINEQAKALLATQKKGKGYSFKNTENQTIIERVITQESHQTTLKQILIRLHGEDKQLDIELSARRIHYKGQSSWLCYLKDVTALLYAEKKLLEERETLSKILNAIPEQVSVKSGTGTILRCSKTWADVHNSSISNVIGKNEDQILSAEELKKHIEQDTLVWQGETSSAQQWFEREGQWSLLNTNKYPLYNKTDQVFAMLTIDTDLTQSHNLSNALDVEKSQRQQAQLETDQQTALLGSVMNASKDAIMVIDNNGLIIAVNAFFANLLERSDSDLIGLQIASFSNLQTSDWLIRDNQQALTSKHVIGFTQKMFIDGQDAYFYIQKTSFHIANTEQQQLVILVQKINHEKSLIEAIPTPVEENLQTEVLLDKLTGIYNRRSFDMQFNETWQQASLEDELLSIVKCNIDAFSKYNAHNGQQKGDQVLIDIAAVLSEKSEELGCSVARYLGAGFIIMIKGGNATKALKITEQIYQAINALKIDRNETTGEELLTVSMGLS